MILAVMILLLAAGDLVLKEWIERQKPEDFPREISKTKGKIWLYRNHNGGFPFGFLEKHGEIVRAVPLAILSGLAGFLACLMQSREHRGEKAGLVLVLAGGLSNLYDRCVRKYVVDYANLRLGFLKKIVFNLGDVFVLAGTVILAVCQLTDSSQRTKVKKV